MTWWQAGGGVSIAPKSDDVIYEQPLIPSLHTTSASSWVKHLTYAIPLQFFGIKVNHLFKLESHKLRPQRRGKTSSVLKPRQQSFILVLKVHLVDLLIPRQSIFLFFPLELLIPYTELSVNCCVWECDIFLLKHLHFTILLYVERCDYHVDRW